MTTSLVGFPVLCTEWHPPPFFLYLYILSSSRRPWYIICIRFFYCFLRCLPVSMFSFLWLFVGKVVRSERAGKASAVVASGRGFLWSCAACYYVITLFLHFHDSSSSCSNRGGEWFITYVLLLSIQFLSPHTILLKLKGRQATGRIAAYLFGFFWFYSLPLFQFLLLLSSLTLPLSLPLSLPSLPPFPSTLHQSQGCTYVLQCRRAKKPTSNRVIPGVESCWRMRLRTRGRPMSRAIYSVSWRGTALYVQGSVRSRSCQGLFYSIRNFGTNFGTAIEPGLFRLSS